MTFKEKVEEVIAGVFFALFFYGCIFLASISDAIDQSIIEFKGGM